MARRGRPPKRKPRAKHSSRTLAKTTQEDSSAVNDDDDSSTADSCSSSSPDPDNPSSSGTSDESVNAIIFWDLPKCRLSVPLPHSTRSTPPHFTPSLLNKIEADLQVTEAKMESFLQKSKEVLSKLTSWKASEDSSICLVTGILYLHTYIHTYIHTYKQTYIHTIIHTYILFLSISLC